MNNNGKTLLVTDGNTRAALAIVRSLGKLGHNVIVGSEDATSLAAKSRYCSASIRYPSPSETPDAFIQFILGYVKQHHIDVVLPVTDITTITITQNKDVLATHTKIPFPDTDIINLAADKVYIYELAHKLGVGTPNTIVVRSKDDIGSLAVDFEYPVVIKPGRSRVPRINGWFYTSVSYCKDHHSLEDSLSRLPSDIFPVLLQERIVGPGVGIFLCFQKGRAVAGFSHRRLREKPPSGGVSVLRESIPIDPVALDFATQLLSALPWEGVAMVEFKLDSRDQTPKLMEINGRFWGSLQLAIDAGVNFPEILLNSLQPEPVRPIFEYEQGVKSRWLWGDIDALAMRIFKNSSEQNLAPGSDSRFMTLLKFLKFWEPGLHYEVLSITDPRPWLHESYQWLSHLRHSRNSNT